MPFYIWLRYPLDCLMTFLFFEYSCWCNLCQLILLTLTNSKFSISFLVFFKESRLLNRLDYLRVLNWRKILRNSWALIRTKLDLSLAHHLVFYFSVIEQTILISFLILLLVQFLTLSWLPTFFNTKSDVFVLWTSFTLTIRLLLLYYITAIRPLLFRIISLRLIRFKRCSI